MLKDSLLPSKLKTYFWYCC